MRVIRKLLLLVLSVFLLFNTGNVYASQIPADGTYQVDITFSGGTGRVTAISPTELIVSGQKMTAKIALSSSNYTYMIVDGEYYYNTAAAGTNSTFIIPISALDTEIKVTACTEAMSTPHEIDYVLKLSSKGTTSSQPVNDPPTTNQNPSNAAGQSSDAGASNPKVNSNDTSNNQRTDAKTEVTADTKNANVDAKNNESTGTSKDTPTLPNTDSNIEANTEENRPDNSESITEPAEDADVDNTDKEQASTNNLIKVVVFILMAVIAALIGIMVYKKKKKR
jgi:hypothetical protein